MEHRYSESLKTPKYIQTPLIMMFDTTIIFYQQPIFYASPENSTYVAVDGEEKMTKTLICFANNAYQIDWIVNGSDNNDDDDHMYQSAILSILQYDISVGDSVEVICRAWSHNRSYPHVDSVLAVIFFQSSTICRGHSAMCLYRSRRSILICSHLFGQSMGQNAHS